MNLQECYSLMGGDYNEVLSRLMKEELVLRFLKKFKDDNMLESLEEAVEEKEWEAVFRISHNLKGVCQNLGITNLAESGSELCETVRNGAPTVDVESYLERVRRDYEVAMEALEQTL